MKHSFDKEDEEQLVTSAIKRIGLFLNKTPTQKEYKENRNNEELSLEQLMYRYGNYSNAVIAAGLVPNPNQSPPRQPDITKDQLIDEYIKVANRLQKIPANNEFRVNSKYSWTPYKTKWGSFSQAAEFIIKNYSDRFEFEIHNKIDKKIKKNRKILNYSCGLIYEPSNEYETVVLFALLAKELGYTIKLVQSDFPDAIIIDKSNLEIIVEFEYLSSNYKQHCHPIDFNGLVICWRKDMELKNISILSLEEYIRGKRNPTTAST